MCVCFDRDKSFFSCSLGQRCCIVVWIMKKTLNQVMQTDYLPIDELWSICMDKEYGDDKHL